MKLGYSLRKKVVSVQNILRRFLGFFIYSFWFFFDLSKFKLIKKGEIKSIMIVNMGKTIGDFYILLGMLNRLSNKYPNIKLYILCPDKNKIFIKNPKIYFVKKNKAIDLISSSKIDALISYTPYLERREYMKVPYRISLEEIIIKKPIKSWPMFSNLRVFPYQKGIIRMFLSFKLLGFDLDNSLDFYYTKEAERFAENFYKKNNKNNQKIIFIHMGSGKSVRSDEQAIPSTTWPSERWAMVADSLIKKYNCRVIFTGVEKEKQIINKVLSKMKNKKKVINLAGKTSIEEGASLLKRGDLLITIDTGMAHIGAQSGIPLIDLFGCFNPIKALPWTSKRTVLFHPEVCTSCMKDACPEGPPQCMSAITVKEVLQAADKHLRDNN